MLHKLQIRTLMLILPLATTGAFPLKAQDIAEMAKEKPVKFLVLRMSYSQLGS